MTTYEKLLTEVRQEFDAFNAMTAKKYVPKLWETLKNENPDLSREELRDRLEKDCIEFWSQRRILEALPDEAKDQKKQKFARLKQKKKISAAETAAPHALNREEIIIDTAGKPIENNNASTPSSDVKEDELDNREDHVKLEFSIARADLLGPMLTLYALNENVIWFDIVINIRTRNVISAAIGEQTRRITDEYL